MSTLAFNTVLITGGAGGLGKAIATWLQQSEKKKVILAGRTESKLQATSKELNNAPYYVLDTSDITSIPTAIEKILKDHPDLDALINNAGVQQPLYFDNFDLEKADQEIDTNIRGPIHLTTALLPHFRKQKSAVIVNVTSVLGFVPMSVMNPVYNGTKAFLHFHTMNLRTQLAKYAPHVKVVEIAPPAVGTDLHRHREDPDDNKKHKNASSLTIEEFMEDIVPQWKDEKTLITAGPGHAITERWYEAFGEVYEERGVQRFE